ncbi:carbohydrate ABC transporter permease [Paenibacillus psychroresistens]|uniref:Carbohydrate ABC transporter permease n=1 Tax=Paenibacillus psychroresistens TaxID=1778678 RepID=A0A6B8RPR4_9BACL|nr:carbohydrate ABC transporter permease [Paenibacillus psychroresistens]QGQ98350.1 carbohydrate ABC transporter permease [Paenibacillus psychroresistens]
MKFNWRHIPLSLVAIYSLFPMVLLVLNSFKQKTEIITNPLGFPLHWTIDNFLKAWDKGDYSTAYLNTIIVTGITVLLTCVICGLAAYGIAFLKTPGSGLLLAYLFISMSLPVGFIPIFFMAVKLNLINNYWGVIIPYVGGGFAFNVFLLRAFMLGIPKDLLESATVDGCSPMRSFFAMILPLAKPAFVVVAIFTTLATWNEIFLSNAILQADHLKTVSVAYLNFSSKYGTNWGLMAAGGVMTVIPMIILFMFMTKTFVTGLQEGSVKF